MDKCSHCLRRADSCPGARMGNLGTARGLMSDYMRHLKLQHNYVSLKIKYQTLEFPHLGGHKHLADGFNHIVEKAEELEPGETAEAMEGRADNEKDAKIAELETLLAEQKQKLAESNNKLDKEQVKKKSNEDPEASKVAKIVIEHTNEIIEYDAEHDKIVTKNETELNRLVAEHCKGKKDKEKKMTLMRNKVFEKVRIYERNRLGITSRSRSNSQRRGRSDDSDSDSESAKSRRMSANQSVIPDHQ